MIDYEFIPWTKNRSTNSIRELAVNHGLKAPEPDLGDIDKLVDMIAQAERPLIICGGGVVRGRADKQFREFAEKLDAPVAHHGHGRRRLPRCSSPHHRYDRHARLSGQQRGLQ